MTSIYELKMGAEKLEALKFLLSQIKDLEDAVKSIDVNELREFRYLADKMQGLSDDVEKSKDLIDKAKNNLAPIVTDVERAGQNAKDEINLKTEAFSALLTRKTEEFEQVKTSFERKYEELTALKSQIEEKLESVTSPIDDSQRSESKTYSSKKIDETYAKKGETPGSVDVSGLATKEELGAKIDEMKANELIAAKTATLATKDELYDKLTTTIYESDKATFALKSQLNAYVTASSLGNYLTRGQLDNALSKYTKAQSITSNRVDFMQGVNFTGSASGQITAGDREAGQSGLVYISGGVSGFSSDFVILNQAEATYGQGYVFFSYFVRPGDNKVLISFIKAA
ncbi:hypothetical protein [Campylobacter showae]|uniref:hypothetical protein n=1 Tax=Campylobacter showae TaxID=204 RepID=UPI000F099B47|nr:hypothetical protein [Campylobacter showae]